MLSPFHLACCVTASLLLCCQAGLSSPKLPGQGSAPQGVGGDTNDLPNPKELIFLSTALGDVCAGDGQHEPGRTALVPDPLLGRTSCLLPVCSLGEK